ncbi:CI repressor [Pseudoxanthomonas winnipegensis]|uniref:CI repressor n=1 Tax=Pseudoxanthomonas winnipegensis TaxID=2480810 RepID=A0A4Q8M260_9GAMM|nr:CI repressor [Pseudoxanthomonas winnipegensis]TAA38209.1 CI repressor [Pseudoxanthomonas winnipegensis]
MADMDALDLAIENAGGVSRLAAQLGLAQTAVSNWRKRGKVPAEQVLKVEAATGVSRYDLRPDVFGPAPTQAADAKEAA